MATITTLTLTAPVVARAQRDSLQTVMLDDYWERISAPEWLARYWTARVRTVRPEPHDEESAECLRRLADALAGEDITEAVWLVQDYRVFTGRPDTDPTLTKMMLECLLDWSQWTGRVDLDDARAEDWIRSLLA